MTHLRDIKSNPQWEIFTPTRAAVIFINWKHILTDRERSWNPCTLLVRLWKSAAVWETACCPFKKFNIHNRASKNVSVPKCFTTQNLQEPKAGREPKVHQWMAKNENAADMHKGALCSRIEGWRLQTRIPVWRSLKVVIGEAQKMAQPVNPSLITGRREPCPESCPLSLHTCCGAYPRPTIIIIINIHFHNAEWKKADTRAIYC